MNINPKLAEFYRQQQSEKLVQQRKEARAEGVDPASPIFEREPFEGRLIKPYQKHTKRELDEERKRDILPGYIVPGTLWRIRGIAYKVTRRDGYTRRYIEADCTGCGRYKPDLNVSDVLRGKSFACRSCSMRDVWARRKKT